ncbi:MAG: hypothetical protein EOO15_06900 [Chitinophagaceae bacterium]|nr:MAG: hypothetical protein EOO15_06900 [Chitinophagaceae bacterium]
MRQLTALLAGCLFWGNLAAQSNAIIDVPPQETLCKACDPPNTNLTTPGAVHSTFNSDNTISVSQPLTISTSPVRNIISIAVFVSYFEFVPGNPDCFTCNRNNATFGNLVKGQIGSTTAAGGGTHGLSVQYGTPQPPGSYPLQYVLSLPPLVSCCEGTVRWCVRVTITFDDCTVCHKILCYERRKSPVGNPIPSKQN